MIGIVLKMGAAGRIFNDVPALLGYTALSLFIYRVGRRALPWLNRFFLWINGFSYSLYLIHVLVLHLFLLIAGVSSLHYFTLLLYLILTLGLAFTFEHAKKAIG